MKWTEAYATGNEQVDEQHKTLFLASEHYREALEAGHGEGGYDLFVEFLSSYAKIHFSFEEECMLARHCPIANQNKQEHCAFAKLIDKEVARFHRDGFDRRMAFVLVDKIDHWLDSHIARVDVQLKSVTP
ncbi:bacteriohemerythrin [Phaeovulum sp.]|uniref:bacteriohemerythrin n=1 Tax=Phaeovulum sp. TaxID=2934796 RepID=UPI00356B1CF8